MAKRKSCVFCGCSDCKITNEHAWPTWTRKLFPPGPTTVLSNKPGEPLGTIRVITVDDMGVKVNVVCFKCNGGWMHDLETEAERLLTPIIRGAAVALDLEQRRLITRWSLKTTMVFEFSVKATPFYSFAERDTLRRTSSLPRFGTAVWLGRYTGDHMSLAHGTKILFDMAVGDRIVPLYAHYSTLAIGEFAFQLLSLRAPDWVGTLQIPQKENWGSDRAVPIWPTHGTVNWPPSIGIDDAGYVDSLTRFHVI